MIRKGCDQTLYEVREHEFEVVDPIIIACIPSHHLLFPRLMSQGSTRLSPLIRRLLPGGSAPSHTLTHGFQGSESGNEVQSAVVASALVLPRYTDAMCCTVLPS